MIWQTLGIPATSDVATIRKAYATRLRECHPGEDPVAFQRLRAAYETALRAARGANATLLVQQAQAQITQLEQSIAQTENQLSLLLGKNPGDIPRGVSLVAQPQYVRISSSCPRGFDDVLVRVQVGGEYGC